MTITVRVITEWEEVVIAKGIVIAGTHSGAGKTTVTLGLKAAMSAHVRMPLLGGLLRDDGLRMPERHLGLTTVDDNPLTAGHVSTLADRMEAGLDLDGLLERLPKLPEAGGGKPVDGGAAGMPVLRMGVARDSAFCFYYPDNLDLLAAAGIRLVPFSPLYDDALPEDLDGLCFGGGYPAKGAAGVRKGICATALWAAISICISAAPRMRPGLCRGVRYLPQDKEFSTCNRMRSNAGVLPSSTPKPVSTTL